MKKLMIALGALAVSVAANAATYSWKATNDSLFLPGQEDDYIASGTAVYLFDAATFTQQAALTAFAGGETISGKAVDSSTVNAGGGISTKTFTYDGQTAGNNWNAYFAIIDGDNIFISDLSRAIGAPADQSTVSISIGDQFDFSTAALTQSSTFGGAGWYAASGSTPTVDTPEPTSGLLLLLGMAGLALKRKRA